MANKTLFSSLGELGAPANAVNEAGGLAYESGPKQQLAQYAVTGCLNATFYAEAEVQLQKVLELCSLVPAEYVAKVALYCRERGFMKDMPALLCAVLASRDAALLKGIFGRVIDTPRMLRNFVQILRSGTVGRKSLGTVPKRLVQQWLESKSDEAVFRASVGQNPSLVDLIKMVHPKPGSPSREALYGYLLGRRYSIEALPELVRRLEAYKVEKGGETPDVPFQMLTALELGPAEWASVARQASWQTIRMNLNTFARHGVYEVCGMTKRLADRLRDPKEIGRARVFPYQLLVSYLNAAQTVPLEIREALQDAMEIAIQNVPQIEGKVYVCTDISGSMQSPLTGSRKGSTTAVRCVDVAALVTAAILRRNRNAEVLPFESKVVPVRLNPRDSVMTNAVQLANLPCGGTNCSAPLALLNECEAHGDLVIYVSDNESWIDSPVYGRFGGGRTETLKQWARFKSRNPLAKMVCVDIQPYATTQAPERKDILNIGGFSDQVFTMIAEFAAGRMGPAHWVGNIEAMAL